MTMKTDVAELTSEKLEEISQRYRQTEVQKCHICGAEMTIQRMSSSRITYGCAGAIYDETGCHYVEGRSLADDHYAESRITVVDVSDPDVLALVEALEKARRHANLTEAERQAYLGLISKRDGRIAELESRTVTVKLPEPFKLAKSSSGLTYYYADEVNEALTEQGIKWEAE